MAFQAPWGPPPSGRPSGTVTFLFSDIEGSTPRWERDRAAMQEAVRRHDAVMNDVIADHFGYTFKTVGDEFCAAFARPEDAIAAAATAQERLAQEDFSKVDGLRVRMAAHTGTADERSGDYFGPTLNRVARLLAIGHGGQVLVSGATADLLRGVLPSRISLTDLGHHRLRDLASPEHVFQVSAPGLAGPFPPLQSLDTLPNNLPVQLKSFVGREREVTEIAQLVQRQRLVTVVGSAGVGKTRTALQVAANMLGRFADGVWVVELAPLTSGDYIPSALAQALGLTTGGGDDFLEAVVRNLKNKEALLVFDNCEHLVEPAGKVMSALLRGCPRLRVLVATRQGVGIEGEETYRLPSLETPAQNVGAQLSANHAIESAAIRLFVERTLAVDKTFCLTDDNASTIADVCRRLDGIPLAIELAAARVRILSPRQLRERLDQRFSLLIGGSRDALPRQQTLRALIDWSYDLLDDRERALFRRVSIFLNGFTLEGAAAIASSDHRNDFEVLDELASLVDKSLVLTEPQAGAMRYQLLETTREYAIEKLVEANEREPMVRRHLHYLRDRFTALWEEREKTGRATELVTSLRGELEDVRAALDRAITSSDVALGAELLVNTSVAWQTLGLEAEAMTRCDAYLAELPEEEYRLRSRLSTAVPVLLLNAGHHARALERAQQAVVQARASGDASLTANALCEYALAAAILHRTDDAEAALNEAEATAVILRNAPLEVRAMCYQFRGQLDEAALAQEQLRRYHGSLGNVRREQSAALNLAEIEHARGRTQRAIAIVQEVLPAARLGDDKILLVSLLINLAGYTAALDDASAAVAAAREAIDVLGDADHTYAAIAAEHLALGLALLGDTRRAAKLMGYSDATLNAREFQRGFTEATTHGRLNALLEGKLAKEELTHLRAEGAALPPDLAIALAGDEKPASG